MKKLILLLFLLPLVGSAKIISKTTNEENPAIGLNSLVLYQYNSKVKKNRGINIQELYLIMGGDISPAFNSMVYISLAEKLEGSWKIDPTTVLIRTTAWENFTLGGGRWFLDFGLHNPYFTFQFPFIDQPELITQTFGPRALIGNGIYADWSLPIPWDSTLLLAFTQANNNVFFHDLKGNFFTNVRWENMWHLPQDNTLKLGFSYGRGEEQINIYGADFKYTWYPKSSGRKLFEWAGEYLSKDEINSISGFYTHFKSELFKDWWIQYRLDYLENIKNHTALVGWVASDKLALRLQFASKKSDEKSVKLQLNMGIGSFSQNTY